MTNGPGQPPLQLVLLIEPDHVNPYVIQKAVEMARELGVELLARLVQDRNVERAAGLPLTRLIGLESGRRGEFSSQRIANQVRRTVEDLERIFSREGRSRGVICRLEIAGEVHDPSGIRWILSGHPAALRRVSLPATRSEVVLILQPPRAQSTPPVTAVVCLAPPTCEQLEWAAQVSAQSGFGDPLVVFTNHPVRCERESASKVSIQGFKPLPRKALTASTLLSWISRHGAASALIILPREIAPGLEEWAAQMARLTEIPLVFLRAAE